MIRSHDYCATAPDRVHVFTDSEGRWSLATWGAVIRRCRYCHLCRERWVA